MVTLFVLENEKSIFIHNFEAIFILNSIVVVQPKFVRHNDEGMTLNGRA